MSLNLNANRRNGNVSQLVSERNSKIKRASERLWWLPSIGTRRTPLPLISRKKMTTVNSTKVVRALLVREKTLGPSDVDRYQLMGWFSYRTLPGPHTAVKTVNKIHQFGRQLLEHPAYNTDLAPLFVWVPESVFERNEAQDDNDIIVFNFST